MNRKDKGERNILERRNALIDFRLKINKCGKYLKLIEAAKAGFIYCKSFGSKKNTTIPLFMACIVMGQSKLPFSTFIFPKKYPAIILGKINRNKIRSNCQPST